LPAARSIRPRRGRAGSAAESSCLTGYKENFISFASMDMAIIFKALADDSRLRIMLLLQLMELSVGELALVLDQSQPRVSRHVRILAEAGLAARHKEGSWVFLRQALGSSGQDGPAQWLDRFLRAEAVVGAELAAQHARDRARLSAIRAQREAHAAAYFADRAADWDAIRSLHIPEAEIEAALTARLADRPLGALLDIGTGTGRMVELLADRADHATALDKSPEMLRLARAKLQHLPPERLALVQADFNALPLDTGRFDTVVLHQVLHFAQSPEQVIAEAGRVAGPDSRIAIDDFAPHAHEVLRERDQHARLGFADAQIAGYLAAADFALDGAESLAGGTLTVKIWIGTRRRGRARPPRSPSAIPQTDQPKKAAA